MQYLACVNYPFHKPALAVNTLTDADKDPFLIALGDRLKLLRARRGLTRKALAQLAEVSERHVANVESGVGNASILFLRQLCAVLNCSLAEMTGDETTSTPDWLMIREVLRGRNEAELAQARTALADLFESPVSEISRRQRIALIGLRGAGKSSLGRLLAAQLHAPFIELSTQIEQLAGCGIAEIHALYGQNAYRRYEQRAIEDVVRHYPQAVIATPGGIVSEPATYKLLLSHCYTVWLKAEPEEHMDRVLAQGDKRPMSGNREAMEDLKRILESRTQFYSKADKTVDTSGLTSEQAYSQLITQLQPLQTVMPNLLTA
jgi:XRE family transcriptional regulator, aerobic/anaerobic benzoate catabolism transcriptional regulator